MPKTTSSTKKKKVKALISPPGIASYAFVWKPQASMNPGQEPKFSITMIIPKKADLSALQEAIKQAAIKKFGANAPALLRKGKLRNPIRDGDEEREDDELYAGKVFFAAKSSQKPRIVDADLNPIDDEFEFYSGCKCRVSVYAYGYDVNGNKGVALALNNVQKLADGERLSGRLAPEDEFGDSDDDDDDDDNDDLM